MGILGDVYMPIEDLVEPTEGLGQRLVGEQLMPVFQEVRELLVDLQIKLLFSHFQAYR